MLLVLLAVACAARCGDQPPVDAGDHTCAVPGFAGRDYTLHLPPSWRAGTPLPVVLALHGGGGKKEGMGRITCAGGDTSDPSCLDAVADREGFAVVYPDGTAGLLGRTWNAGGGTDGWRCVSGAACKDGVDDLAYFDALLDDLEAAVAVDTARIYATGLSNGAAMTHRLACERADRFAAIAPVSGANQFAAAGSCTPSRPVPVLHVHGTDDPCWSYAGGAGACLQKDGGVYVSVDASMAGWADRDGCDGGTTEEALPDLADDGTNVTRVSWGGCAADVQLLRVDGGGHAWPGGYQYAKVDTVGVVSEDVVASDLIWAFFAAHPMAR
jgi:polyhydroxybutyrate depolymerase